MNSITAPISENISVEQQIVSPEFPVPGKNVTRFSNSPSRIHIELQKIHINKDLDKRESSICGIKEIKLVYKDNRDDINQIKCKEQNQHFSLKNEEENIANTSGGKRNIENDFVKNPQLGKVLSVADGDVIIYQLVIKENKPSNVLIHNNSSYIKDINNRDKNNILGKTSDYKRDTQNATFEFDGIYGSFCPQGQNIRGTNNLSSLRNNKQVSFNKHDTTERSFEQQEFIDTTKKERNTVFRQENFNWNFGAHQSQNISDADNQNNTDNDRQVAIDRHDTSGINFEQKAFFRTNGKGQEQYLKMRVDNETEFVNHANKCIDDNDENAGARNIRNIKNPITEAILNGIYKPSSFISLSETESRINDVANIMCTVTNIKKLRFCVVLELCIGSISNDTNTENRNQRTKQIRLKVSEPYIKNKKQTLALEIKLGHYDRRVALRSLNRAENIAASTIGRDAYLSIVIGVPSDVRYIVLNIPEDPQYEIDIESATLQVLKNTEREIMFDIRSDDLLQNKKIINKEDLLSQNNYKNLKFDISDSKSLLNENMVNKEGLISQSNCESQKLVTKNNEGLLNENITDKWNFDLPNNNENTKVGTKNNEALSNEKKTDEENFLSPNNYGTQKFDTRNDEELSNEKIITKKDPISPNNYGNLNLDLRIRGTFSNENVDNKGNSVASNNAEGAENRNHESEPSVGILGRVAGFFGQIMGICRRKK